MSQQVIATYEKLYDTVMHINIELTGIWAKYMVFTWQWWLGVALAILPWVVWIFIRKKESANRLLYAAFIVAYLGTILNILGEEFGLWDYYSDIEPLTPAFIPWDLTLLPVAVMFFLQYFPKISPWIKAVVFSAFASFVVQPVFVWLGMYDRKEWKDWYSFPIFIAIYVIVHYIVNTNNFARLNE